MQDSAMDDSGDMNAYVDAEPYMVSGYENVYTTARVISSHLFKCAIV
jgi:hypothetical protein